MLRVLLIAPLAAALLLVACGGDDEGGGPATSAATQGTEQAQLSFADELPDGFPTKLVYPDSSFQESLSDESDPNRQIVFLSTSDGIDDILDYYEDAISELGLGEDGERVSIDTLGSLLVGDEDTGTGVIVEAGAADDGDNLITVGYYKP